MLGNLLGDRDLAVRPSCDVVEPVDRRHRRAATRGEDDCLARNEDVVTDGHPALAGEPALAPKKLNVAALEPWHLAGVVEIGNHLVAAGKHGGDVQVSRHCLCSAGDPLDLGQDLSGAQ